MSFRHTSVYVPKITEVVNRAIKLNSSIYSGKKQKYIYSYGTTINLSFEICLIVLKQGGVQLSQFYNVLPSACKPL